MRDHRASASSELCASIRGRAPGALIALAVLAFNFVGDALRDAADVRGN